MAKTRNARAKRPEGGDDFAPMEVAGTTHVHPEDADGDIAEEFEPDVHEDDEEDYHDDPSAGNALSQTETVRTAGQQAALAEIKDYLRRRKQLEEERLQVNEDIKQLDKEFKNKGYDAPAMKLIFKIDSMTTAQKNKRREQNMVNATYAHAAGIDEDLI